MIEHSRIFNLVLHSLLQNEADWNYAKTKIKSLHCINDHYMKQQRMYEQWSHIKEHAKSTHVVGAVQQTLVSDQWYTRTCITSYLDERHNENEKQSMVM